MRAPLYRAERQRLERQRSRPDMVELDRLPEIAWTTEIAGTVTARAAAETGLAAGTPVIVGTIDAAAEAVSVGVLDGRRHDAHVRFDDLHDPDHR